MTKSKKVKHAILGCLSVILLLGSQVLYAGDTANFLTIADIHFDPFATCASTAPCPLIQHLQEAPVEEWSKILEKSDTANPVSRVDTTYVLLKSALAAIKTSAAENHAKFIIVLGDSITHKFQEKYNTYAPHKSQHEYQQFVKKTMAFVAGEFHKEFPNHDVYFTVGNNDSYRGDYDTQPNSEFFQDVLAMWGKNIRSEDARRQMEKTFTTAGYYAVDIPQLRGLRLVVLNSNLFSAQAPLLAADAARQFDWFEKELKEAREHHQHVLVAMHIPVGIDVFSSLKQLNLYFKIVEMWRPEYTLRFEHDLQEFGEIFSGILNGHTHSDSFAVVEVKNSKFIALSSTPSISPIFGNNPGFKVYSLNPQEWVLQNYTTTYSSLASLSWEQEYDFDAIYQNEDAMPESLADIMKQLTTSDTLAQFYQLYYDTSSNTAPIHKFYEPYYRCQLKAITATEYQTCMAK